MSWGRLPTCLNLARIWQVGNLPHDIGNLTRNKRPMLNCCLGSYTAQAAASGAALPTSWLSVSVSVRLSNGFTMKSVAPSLKASFRMFFCPAR